MKNPLLSVLLTGNTNALKHGGARGDPRHWRREYRIWRGIINRCLNTGSTIYPYYGGRGIGVCSRWRNFSAFLKDMGQCPSPRYEIEREDNEGNYEPSNCKWATRKENCRNKRNNHRITANGETLCLADWALRLGCRHTTIVGRLKSGWSEEAAVTTPVKYQRARRRRWLSM